MKLHYQGYGERGAPLIILHGLFGSLENWLTVSRRLSADFRVFALDLRNHGRSPHSPEMTLSLMADDVEEFMLANHLETAHLLGHSLGGKVAMQLALNAPGRVSRLVVVDIAPRAYPPQHGDLLHALLALDICKYENRGQAEHALAASIPDQAVRRFLIKNIVHEPGNPMAWRMDLQSIARNYGHLIGGLPRDRQFLGPALFLRGAESNYIVPQDESVIREVFPDANIRTIPGAGHWVHVEATQVFCREVLHFLR